MSFVLSVFSMVFVRFCHRSSVYLALAYLLVVLLQWLHFTLYFKQAAGVSLIWSLVDWGVWFALFVGLSRLMRQSRQGGGGSICIPVTFVLLAGVIQITIACMIYYVIFEADKALLTSISQSLNKRWLQNLMIAAIMVLLLFLLRKPARSIQEGETTDAQVPELENFAPDGISEKELSLFDGKHYHRLFPSDVLAVVANKNYLSVYTENREIVIRSTLKTFSNELNDSRFVQISRSAIINREAIDGLFKYSRTSYRVKMLNNHEFNVSKTYLPELKALFS
ncbi:LytTR family DNA-binding domain-containing protein [Planctobacterium marinum]|uniref:HTH LytTR-type domain-containing protein n=1 Tax=Planctobacterium marinum TaxID=1631968 RepID=A0AA48HEF9_9ALTE|nr:hypothetical protein MACH26_03570 [Planctobacterium marinum]